MLWLIGFALGSYVVFICWLARMNQREWALSGLSLTAWLTWIYYVRVTERFSIPQIAMILIVLFMLLPYTYFMIRKAELKREIAKHGR